MARILVIDDEKSLLDEIVDHLQFSGHEVTGTTDSLAASRLAGQLQPDVIVCDVMMPQLDGYGVLLAVRSQEETATTPFIFLTAKADYEAQRIGMRKGADDYLYKPFSFAELLQAIDVQLQKSIQREREYKTMLDGLQSQLVDGEMQLAHQAEFMGMMIHDCKTPLSVMLSSTQLLKRYHEKLSDDRREYHLQNLERQIHKMTGMMDDLLWVVRRGTTDHSAKIEGEVDISAVCQMVCDDVALQFCSHEIICRGMDTPAICQGDAHALERMLLNLVGNAAKYSPAGSQIYVEFLMADDHVHIMVADEGIGIPEIDQSRLFGAFQRASNVADVEGTGLGLMIVDEVVKAHHGRIEFESYEGEGTTFIVSLPIEPSSADSV